MAHEHDDPKASNDRELAIKEADARRAERDQAFREREADRARWWNPLMVAIVAGTIAAFANMFVAWNNGKAELTLEQKKADEEQQIEKKKAENELAVQRKKADDDLILEIVKTGDAERANENLRFLVDANIISDPDRSAGIKRYVNTSRPPGTGVALASSGGSVSKAKVLGTVYYEVGKDGNFTNDGPLAVLPIRPGQMPDFLGIKAGTFLRAEHQVNLREPKTNDFIATLDTGWCVQTIKDADKSDQRLRLSSARSGGRLDVQIVECPKQPSSPPHA